MNRVGKNPPEHRESREKHPAPPVLCVLCLNSSWATSVSLTGDETEDSFRLLMTRSTEDLWIARLVLSPGTHTFKVHVVHADRSVLAGQSGVMSWESQFTVPSFSQDENITPEIRIWLHKTTETSQDY